MAAADSQRAVYDVCIVGAGVVGCTVARELSRFDLKVIVLEKELDVSCGATKANSGIVHGGYSAKHGTLKAALCRAGNRMYARLEQELSFGYRETGSLVLAFDSEQQATLRTLMDNGRANGVDDLELIDVRRLRQMEPSVSEEVVEALFCPGAGVASPYELAIALAENAVRNGVEYRLGREVTGLRRIDGEFKIQYRSSSSGVSSVDDGDTPGARRPAADMGRVGTSGQISARFAVNAAGLYSDRITAMVTDPGFTIHPRQGQYIVFERGYGSLVNTVVFQTPTEAGKGILVTPTYHNNLMIGPNANEIGSREDVNTDEEVLEYVVRLARTSVPEIDLKKAITTFAGIRASADTGDFIIGPAEVAGFVQAAGIDSPGLTTSPAIAERVRDLLADQGLDLKPDPSFDPYREPIIRPKESKEMADEEVSRLLKAETPDRLICRCERVSAAEILDAMSRGLPVESIDAVKRRTRAGMGRCQGGFCRPRVAKLLAEESGIPSKEILRRHEAESARKNRVKARLLRMRDDF